MPEQPLMVCAVCGRVLDEFVLDGVGRYMHTLKDQRREDHPAVPVLASEIVHFNARCDFCGDDVSQAEVWTVPSRDFFRAAQVAGEPPTVSQGDWAACPVCAELICAGDWNGVIARVARTHKLTHPMILDMVREDYARLRIAMTGAPYKGTTPRASSK